MNEYDIDIEKFYNNFINRIFNQILLDSIKTTIQRVGLDCFDFKNVLIDIILRKMILVEKILAECNFLKQKLWFLRNILLFNTICDF